MVATAALTLLFGRHETSDAWADALWAWWLKVRNTHKHIRRLVIDLDNGPKNSGRRTQFLKRMVQLADRTGLVIRLVYYPPYHSPAISMPGKLPQPGRPHEGSCSHIWFDHSSSFVPSRLNRSTCSICRRSRWSSAASSSSVGRWSLYRDAKICVFPSGSA